MMGDAGVLAGNQAPNDEILPSDNTNNYSLVSLNEIEKKLVEHSFEQAAELQNLKIQCEENDTIINNLRTDITKSHLGLEKLDELYNAELCRREDVKDVVKVSKESYDELVDKIETIERKIKIGSSLVNNIALLNDAPENTLAADKALNQQIDTLIHTTHSTLKDFIDYCQNMAALEVSSKEQHCLMSEKNKLVHFIISVAEENRRLEDELSIIDESGAELESARRAREMVTQEVEELKLKCDELDTEQEFLKNEMNVIKQDNQLKDHCLNVIDNQTKQIDVEILMKEKVIDDIKAEIDKLKINIAESEIVATSEIKMWEDMVKERKTVLCVNEETVEFMTKQYSEFKQLTADNVVEDKELSNKNDAISEKIKLLKGAIIHFNMEDSNNKNTQNLLETKVLDAQLLLNSAEEKLSSQTSDNQILAAELNGLNQNLEQVANGNCKLNSIKEELLDKENELLEQKEKLSKSIAALELKIQEIKVEDVDLKTMEDPLRGETLLENLKSGISVWKEGMDSAINDLAEQKIERENELKNRLKSIQELLDNAKMKIVPNEVIENLKARNAELVKEIQNQENEKIRLMAELKGTQDKITVTVNSNSNLPLSQSSIPTPKTRKTDKKNIHQADPKVYAFRGFTSQQTELNRKRRLYNPPTVSSTVALESDSEYIEI